MITLKTLEPKVMRDPIHEYIHIEYQVIWDIINSREFQRLRRIHQMGTSYQVYHTAEHSRFSHSCGVYEIVRRMIHEVDDLKEALSEEEKIQIMLAGLLHDVGHGPFSHFFESIIKQSHETMTCRILNEESQVHRILESYQTGLSRIICSILDHTHPKTLLTSIISSQMDADRMDYLLRDAYFTGTSYGHFDIERILRTLRVAEDRLVIKNSGVHSIEDYIMARYHMYWQVYFHPTSRAIEAILLAYFKRFQDLIKSDPSIMERYPMFAFMNKTDALTIEDHYRLDENSCMYGFHCTSLDPDPILRDLSIRILERKLFDYRDLTDQSEFEAMKPILEARGFDPRYYLYQDSATKRPYSPYNEENNLIYVLMPDQSVKELSQVSTIVHAIVNGPQKSESKMFYPKEEDTL